MVADQYKHARNNFGNKNFFGVSTRFLSYRRLAPLRKFAKLGSVY